MSRIVSKERLKLIAAAAQKHGYEGAAKVLGLSQEGVRRRCREWKSLGNKLFIPRNPEPVSPQSGPRILVMDIETSPTLGYTWDFWKASINPEQIVEDSVVLCWAAKWADCDGIMYRRSEKWRDDRSIVQELADMLGKADIVVAHNGKAFDISRVWARLAYYSIPPPQPFKVVDTVLLARTAFNFPHNSLAGLARYLNIGAKAEHEGFGLWVKCMADDADAWARMEKYNIQDVLLLEDVYLRLRPYDRKHPNVALYYADSDIRCVRCGAAALKESPEPTYTAVSEFPLFQCEQCGAWCRSGSRTKREPVMRSVV